MQKIMTNLLIIAAVISGIMLLLYFYMNQNTSYVHCVRVAQTENFTGIYLKNDNAIFNEVVTIDACSKLDKTIDTGNGNKTGLVRWAACLNGPDCDEAGIF